MKILVTGAAGFIGFHTAKRLLEDRDRIVVGIDNMNDYYDPILKYKRNAILKKNKNYRFYKADICNRKKINFIFKKEKPEVVIHLAAQAGVRYSLKDPWVYANSNYIGTLSIFEAARKHGVMRVLYASSSSVYGSNKKSPFSESDRTDSPLSLYAATKKANEVLAHSYNHLFGMNMIGFRFFTVYGPWGRPDMAIFRFVRSIRGNLKITLYNKGNMSRSFTYIDDIVEPLLLFVDKNEDYGNRIYNLDGTISIKIKPLVKLLEKVLDTKAKIKFGPMYIADVPKTESDTSTIKKDTGFSAKTPIEIGLRKFTEWYMENEPWLTKLQKPKQ